MTDSILSYAQAVAAIREQSPQIAPLARCSQLPHERVSLPAALGRVLAAPLLADRDHPPFDRATRDGYAVQAEALSRGGWLPVEGTLRAGEPMLSLTLRSGVALEIMTGAPVPPGADAVVMLEHVEAADGRIRLQNDRRLKAGDNIVPAGREARRGDLLAPAGTRLGARHIAIAAAVGAAQLDVFALPRVAILATGDELVAIEAPPLPHQIRNSNSATLAALVTLAGGTSVQLGVARDELDHLRALLDRIWPAQGEGECDMLLLSGGVSAGKYDLVEQALAERGAHFRFTGVRIQPGRPAVFGELPPPTPGGPPLPFFGLPGNPVSTMVTFLLFAAPMLRALGWEADATPRFAQARLAHAEAAVRGITRFLPARLSATWDSASVRRIPWHGSGDLAATAQSNCFVVLPEDAALDAGDPVQVLLT